MIYTAILLIIVTVIVTAYLITKETNSNKPERRYGKIIGISSFIILAIVVSVGYMFITYFK